MKALALTEHGNCSSHVQLEKACNKFGIKPIFGVEAYIAPPKQARKCHQTILAADQTGLANLNKIVTQSWHDFYRWPTVHLSYLEEFSDGLIVLSGCADSTLACTLLGGKSFGEQRLDYSSDDYKRAVALVEWYKGVFGDRYIIETQVFPELARTRVLNPAFERLSADTGIQLAATHDCHLVTPDQSEMRAVLHAANRGSTVAQAEASWEYDIPSYIPTSDTDIHDRLVQTGLSEQAAEAALLNTGVIADRCNVVLPKVEPIKYQATESDWESWV
jgi:DNA polymerase-3 subunit alpha